MSDNDLIRRADALAIVVRDRVPTNRTGSEFRVVSTQDMLKAIAALPPAKQDDLASGKAVTVGVPTEAQIVSACLSYDHSFGLMDGPQRVALMHQAREWFHAWRSQNILALIQNEKETNQ